MYYVNYIIECDLLLISLLFSSAVDQESLALGPSGNLSQIDSVASKAYMQQSVATQTMT